jgi:hypothetical protein
MKNRILFAAMLGLTMAYAGLASAVPNADAASGLRAEISVSDSSDEIVVRYRNDSGADIAVGAQELASGVLALSVETREGAALHPLPPPVPDPAAGSVTLRPGAERIERYRLSTMFDPPLAPGEYRVDVKLAGSSSNEVIVRIR